MPSEAQWYGASAGQHVPVPAVPQTEPEVDAGLDQTINVLGGPVPINIYYSTDQGQTVMIAYAFGHNPSFHDRDAKTGAPLGDPDNPVICRHIHSVVYNPAENAPAVKNLTSPA